MYSATKCTASAREEKWERYRHSVFKLPKKLSITASAQRSYDACHDLPITLQVENAELLGMDNGRSDNCILWKNVARETWRGLPMPCCAHCARQGEQYGSTRRLETVEVKIALCRCEMDGQAIINSGSCWPLFKHQEITSQALPHDNRKNIVVWQGIYRLQGPGTGETGENGKF